jgi:succinoglycan biosynthesis protein ExoL
VGQIHTDAVRILYLAHDLSDAAVHKRVAMLRDGGAVVTVAGFRRAEAPVREIAGAPAINLGLTRNGAFLHRVLAVLRETLFLRRDMFEDADIVIARNLEMLALGVRGKTHGQRLVYESLDIHRLLLNNGPVGKCLRWLEGRLSRRACALLTSSPAFVRAYFEPLSSVRLPVRLVENKVYAPDLDIPASSPRAPGPPWRIGWFGAIRCKKSLHMLQKLVRNSGGKIEVVIRGRPALDQIPDFHETVAATAGMTFGGAYKNPDDLPALYRGVHFTWAIDMFEEGLNSSWLLPNRVYEGGLFDAVPIALESVETGRFLEGLGLGIRLKTPVFEPLKGFFEGLTIKDYQSFEKSAMEKSRHFWRYEKKDCVALVEYLTELK